MSEQQPQPETVETKEEVHDEEKQKQKILKIKQEKINRLYAGYREVAAKEESVEPDVLLYSISLFLGKFGLELREAGALDVNAKSIANVIANNMRHVLPDLNPCQTIVREITSGVCLSTFVIGEKESIVYIHRADTVITKEEDLEKIPMFVIRVDNETGGILSKSVKNNFKDFDESKLVYVEPIFEKHFNVFVKVKQEEEAQRKAYMESKRQQDELTEEDKNEEAPKTEQEKTENE